MLISKASRISLLLELDVSMQGRVEFKPGLGVSSMPATIWAQGSDVGLFALRTSQGHRDSGFLTKTIHEAELEYTNEGTSGYPLFICIAI